MAVGTRAVGGEMDLVQQYSSSLHTLPDSITPWLRFGLGKPYTLNPNARQERDVYFAQGRRLLALTQADLYQLVDTKLDADLLSDAIHDLRLRAVRSPSSFETGLTVATRRQKCQLLPSGRACFTLHTFADAAVLLTLNPKPYARTSSDAVCHCYGTVCIAYAHEDSIRTCVCRQA